MNEMLAVYDGGQMPDIFLERNPQAVVKRYSEVASAVADVIEKGKLFVIIGKRKHVLMEGWQTLGALVGVFASVKVTDYVQEGEDWGYHAEAVAHRLNGEEISAASAECWSSEKNWQGRDRFQVRSMAQTRACAKAFRLALGFVMPLAGYEATPAEEMDGIAPQPQQSRYGTGPHRGQPPAPRQLQPATDALPAGSEMKTVGHVLNAALNHYRLKRDDVYAIEGVEQLVKQGNFSGAWAAIVYHMAPDIRPDAPEDAGDGNEPPLGQQQDGLPFA